MASHETETVKVLERALVVLDALKDGKRPIGVNELAKICGYNPSTVFRIVKTLEQCGWAQQLADDKYIVGYKLTYETEKDNFYLALKDVAHPIMCLYTAQENQAMNLCVRQGEKCIVIGQSRTERLVDFIPPLGAALPLYASGNGKVLFCDLPDSLLHDLLNMIEFQIFTSRTITTRQAFLNELKKVKEQNYAMDLDESVESTCCIAVPIRNLGGDIIAAISFSGFVGNYDEEYLKGYLPVLYKVSDEITRSLYKNYPKIANETFLALP